MVGPAIVYRGRRSAPHLPRAYGGFVLAQLIASLLIVAALAGGIGYTVFSIASTDATAQKRTLSGQLLTQASYRLATESADVDGDGFPESPAGTDSNGDGWNVPVASSAPKSDAWGSPFKYCAWDNGSSNSSSGRLAGDNPGTQASIVFAVISAGPDKTFNTTCAQAKSGAAQGDDGVRVMSVSQIKQGVGGTRYYGDPVDDDAALAALSTAGIPVGLMRLVKSTGTIKYWNGTMWNATVGVPPGAPGLAVLLSSGYVLVYDPIYSTWIQVTKDTWMANYTYAAAALTPSFLSPYGTPSAPNTLPVTHSYAVYGVGWMGTASGWTASVSGFTYVNGYIPCANSGDTTTQWLTTTCDSYGGYNLTSGLIVCGHLMASFPRHSKRGSCVHPKEVDTRGRAIAKVRSRQARSWRPTPL